MISINERNNNRTVDAIVINGDVINWSSERNPTDLPWADLNVDLVCECTGVFTSREKAAMHIEAGAKKVIISAPGTNVDATVVYGVNDHILDGTQEIISNASCTTNCLAPMVQPLQESIGILSGYMTTVHARPILAASPSWRWESHGAVILWVF